MAIGEAGKKANPKYTKTYSTYKRAVTAADKMVELCSSLKFSSEEADVRYVISVNEDSGRFFPVFVGRDCNAVIFHGFIWIG